LNDTSQIKLRINIDERIEVIEEKVYMITDVMTEVGGMAHTLIIFGFVFVSLFQDKLFQAALIKEIY
jgi:hypothetical protein